MSVLHYEMIILFIGKFVFTEFVFTEQISGYFCCLPRDNDICTTFIL